MSLYINLYLCLTLSPGVTVSLSLTTWPFICVSLCPLVLMCSTKQLPVCVSLCYCTTLHPSDSSTVGQSNTFTTCAKFVNRVIMFYIWPVHVFQMVCVATSVCCLVYDLHMFLTWCLNTICTCFAHSPYTRDLYSIGRVLSLIYVSLRASPSVEWQWSKSSMLDIFPAQTLSRAISHMAENTSDG